MAEGQYKKINEQLNRTLDDLHAERKEKLRLERELAERDEIVASQRHKEANPPWLNDASLKKEVSVLEVRLAVSEANDAARLNETVQLKRQLSDAHKLVDRLRSRLGDDGVKKSKWTGCSGGFDSAGHLANGGYYDDEEDFAVTVPKPELQSHSVDISITPTPTLASPQRRATKRPRDFIESSQTLSRSQLSESPQQPSHQRARISLSQPQISPRSEYHTPSGSLTAKDSLLDRVLMGPDCSSGDQLTPETTLNLQGLIPELPRRSHRKAKPILDIDWKAETKAQKEQKKRKLDIHKARQLRQASTTVDHP